MVERLSWYSNSGLCCGNQIWDIVCTVHDKVHILIELKLDYKCYEREISIICLVPNLINCKNYLVGMALVKGRWA